MRCRPSGMCAGMGLLLVVLGNCSGRRKLKHSFDRTNTQTGHTRKFVRAHRCTLLRSHCHSLSLLYLYFGTNTHTIHTQ